MAFMSKIRADDLDHGAAMEALFDRLGEVLPGAVGWVAIHCIDEDHDDESKSASVNPAIGGYRCHACGLTGDAFSLYQHFFGGTFVDAKEALLGGSDHSLAPEPDGVGARGWL